MIKLVLFDFNDVLTKDNFDAVQKSLAYYSISLPDFAKLIKQLGFDDLIESQISYKDFAKKVEEKTKIPKDELLKIFGRANFDLDRKVLKIVERLRENYRTAIFTDYSPKFMKNNIKIFNLEKYFEKIINSNEVGIVKIDQNAYIKVSEILRLKPEEILYIDNDKENIKAAKSAGFKTVLFKGEDSLSKSLAKLGVL